MSPLHSLPVKKLDSFSQDDSGRPLLKQRARYEEYLSSVECSTLKSVALSPEYDEASKAAIVKHLSIRKPGWSIQHQE